MQQFNVQGMTCGHCVRAVIQAIMHDDPGAEVEVDLTTGVVQVSSSLSTDALSHLISAEGYGVTSKTQQP